MADGGNPVSHRRSPLGGSQKQAQN